MICLSKTLTTYAITLDILYKNQLKTISRVQKIHKQNILSPLVLSQQIYSRYFEGKYILRCFPNNLNLIIPFLNKLVFSSGLYCSCMVYRIKQNTHLCHSLPSLHHHSIVHSHKLYEWNKQVTKEFLVQNTF